MNFHQHNPRRTNIIHFRSILDITCHCHEFLLLGTHFPLAKRGILDLPTVPGAVHSNTQSTSSPVSYEPNKSKKTCSLAKFIPPKTHESRKKCQHIGFIEGLQKAETKKKATKLWLPEAVKKSLDQLPQGLKLHLGKNTVSMQFQFAPTIIRDLKRILKQRCHKFHFNSMKSQKANIWPTQPVDDAKKCAISDGNCCNWLISPKKGQWQWYCFSVFNSRVAQLSFGTRNCWAAAKGPWGGPLVRGEPDATCELTSKSSPSQTTETVEQKHKGRLKNIYAVFWY